MIHNAAIDTDGSDGATAARVAERARDAGWVRDAVAGDREAFGRLYDAWFDRVFHLVARLVHDEETVQDICQEAFLSAWRGLGGLQDPGSFGGWLLRIARNAAFNRSAKEARSRPIDDRGFAVIEETSASPTSAPAGFDTTSRLSRAAQPDVAAGDRELISLVREAAAALPSRDAEVLDLQLRYELSPAEIGEVVGLNRNAANQLCHRVRGRFATAFRARMLWNGGHPDCEELDHLLTAQGVTSFGATAVSLIDRHASSCADCDERRRTLVQPAALFAAIPFAAPTPVRAEVAGRLASHGVPMDGSTATTGPAAPSASDPGPSAPPTGTAPPIGLDRAAMARRLFPAVTAALVLVVLVQAFLLLRPEEGDGLLMASSGTTTSVGTAAGPPRSSVPDGGAPIGPAPTGGGSPPVTDGTPTLPPTTAAPPPTIDVFTLAPAGSQPTPYTVGPGSPTLRWATTGATSVAVRTWFDDGVTGPQPGPALSTEPSGELQVCPGTLDGTSCSAPPGTYSYGLEIIGADGTAITSDQGTRPWFEVYVVIG